MFAVSVSALSIFSAQATIVEFQTSQGNFKVNLHDETTPKTVENFLGYVNEGFYTDTLIHRTVDGNTNVIQGGGARFEGVLPPSWLDAHAPIINEPVYSNVIATISMAKTNNINSATSQWFINTKNNANNWDPINSSGGGAYAVFGEVIEDGMDVVNAIAAIQRCNTRHSGFTELPMPDYTTEQCSDTNHVPGVENFVTINQIVIIDSSTVTDANLNSAKNTLYQPTTGTSNNSSSSGGGSLAWYSLAVLGLISSIRKLKSK